jgi:PRC-barrel domain
MSTSTRAALERGPVSEYWLRHCQGFRVDSADGRIGTVENVRFDSPPTRPQALAVRVGLFGKRLLIVPVSEVKAILPRQHRVLLPASPRLLATEAGAAGTPSAG